MTGANGFIGSHLCAHLARCGWNVHAVVRKDNADSTIEKYASVHYLSDVTNGERWIKLLRGADVVVHLAARVHVMKDIAVSAAEEYRRVNTTGTAMLARLAAQHGVTRFVFLSTIKVNGERTIVKPFLETDVPMPSDEYSLSKWEAEQKLAEIASNTEMKVIALRPPLLYGPGVKGNFLRLMNLVRRRVPLPLASVTNSRSFLYVGNLLSAVEKVLSASVSKAETFLVSDDHDISTPQLIRMLADAMNVEARLLRCPLPMLLSLAKIAGKTGEVSRMIESLSIDCSRIKQQLHWAPPFTVVHGIQHTVRWFLETR